MPLKRMSERSRVRHKSCRRSLSLLTARERDCVFKISLLAKAAAKQSKKRGCVLSGTV